MRIRTCLLGLFAALLIAAPAAQAAPAPAWQLSLTPVPANFAVGGESEYLVLATNTGAASTSGPLTLEVDLPAGISPLGFKVQNTSRTATSLPTCTTAAPGLNCQTSEPMEPGRQIEVHLEVAVAAGAESTATASISGGGAPQGATATAQTPISPDPVAFDFLPGFQVPAIDEAGTPASAAGSHPHQLTVDFTFPTKSRGSEVSSVAPPRDILFDLPPGYLGNPTAAPVLCTEAELEATEECPEDSQVGVISLITQVGGVSPDESPLYAMVPPPGAPAELAFDGANVALFIHLLASLRSDGDYGITTTTPDILALPGHPVIGARVQLWGDASSPAHNDMRNKCVHHGVDSKIPCNDPLPSQRIPFLTLPGSCSGAPSVFGIHADSWIQPGLFKSATYSSADAEGNPVSVSGCSALEYQPTISAQPTTNLADSPSGLEFQLHQPQEPPHDEPLSPLSGKATAELKDARVTLPAGMVANPAQADGLAGCSEAQIGYLGESHYSKQPQSCPDGARLGTLEVTSPLLAQRNDEEKLVLDPGTGEPLLEPLHGSVFLAQPFKNQFGSLLAIYLAIEDPKTGVVAKLAGKVEPDPNTGQLTATFEDNPQLPLEDIRLSLFKGARGPLVTPPVCGSHTTVSTLTPWTSPEGADAHPQSSFQTIAGAGGGGCPASEGAQPNSPSFSAGTLSAQAGAYSPFVLRISREDGSQRITGIDTTLAPGLIGKLAGIAECPDAAIAQAQARHNPEEGRLERESPSCPLSSEVGTVNVGAGAGPNPIYTQGHAYLAGPYKGAPLSLVVITPAIAGPFDLGTVVVRIALYVDPVTAQIHAVSDPLPQILDGIPLDIRSVALKMDRPDFTLNPTNCEPLAITGTATSALGQAAALSQRFQVGGCSALAFKPKLKLAFKGGTKRTKHPALTSMLTYPKQGSFANIARAVVTLPHSEIIDQAHVGNPCTRPQFAAEACPKISILGRAKAWSPLLEKPLEGNVYFRSNGGERPLPDIVADLRGQIHVELIGAVDTASPKKNARIRTTFFQVPDAPVSRFQLELKGGKEGLLVNSQSLCRSPQKALVELTGQNGKTYDTAPAITNQCPKHKK
jgi:hypothetical protein